MAYAEVVIENKSKYVDNYFTYEIGSLDVKIGSKVKVSFGTKEKFGYVFSIKEETDVPKDKIKAILEVIEEESLNEEIIKTCLWMKQRYAIKYFDAIKCFVPTGKPTKEHKKKEPYKDLESDYVKPEILTNEQNLAITEISSAIENKENEAFLIHGVTASGKTEVYMEVMEKTLEMDRTVIFLVPEISLTPQIINRFIGRFGKDIIAVLHSKLTQRERYDEWERIKNNKAKIVIGARMGVFAPLDNIGLIIMDEEHEATYKSDMTPKYDTVEVAYKRLQYYKGVLVLGSATPSIVSYNRFREGIYNLIELKERYNKTPLPDIEIVDMRQELRKGNISIFSRKLFNAMEEAIKNKEQVILLQNRRGYSNFVSCRECGYVMKCPECNISLTYHKSVDKMVCHYCGREQKVPNKCPECESKYIKYFGIGTEQVEEQVKEYFPDAKVERLDLDAIKNRRELEAILKRFSQGKTDVLVGTQLVAKGLDFKNVALVGVVSADTTLNIPDYRSSERTFQLITQVAGRAGRGEKQGQVIIQTYEPNNYALIAAKSYDYGSFYQAETYLRNFMEYPPFGHIIGVYFTGEREDIILEIVDTFQTYMSKALGKDGEGRILKPKLANNFKGQGSIRYYVLLKCPIENRNKWIFYINDFIKKTIDKKIDCNVNVDINPYSI